MLTKKPTQQEGQKQDKPIKIEEDEEDAEIKEIKDDKGKEKAPEEGHEMVQHKAGTSSLAPSSSKAREVEGEESEEDEDEIQGYLNDMLKAMQKVDRANT